MVSQCFSSVWALEDPLPNADTGTPPAFSQVETDRGEESHPNTKNPSYKEADNELDSGEESEEPEEEDSPIDSGEIDSGIPPEVLPPPSAPPALLDAPLIVMDSGPLDFLDPGTPQIVKSVDSSGNPTPFDPGEARRDGNCVLYFTYTLREGLMTGVPYQMQLPDQIKNIQQRFSIKGPNGEVGQVTVSDTLQGPLLSLTLSDLDCVKGKFWLGGSFDADKLDNNGKTELEFLADGTTINKVPVDFAVDPIVPSVALEKDAGTITPADLQAMRIPWVITAKPSIKNAKDDDRYFTEWTITDTLPTGGENDKLVFLTGTGDLSVQGPEGAYTGGKVEFSPDSRSFTYTFGENLKINEGDSYKITVYTKFSLEAFEAASEGGKAVFQNSVTTAVKSPQYQKNPDTGLSEIDPDQSAALKEPPTATAKSEVSGVTLDKEGAMKAATTAEWTVTVTNSLNLSNPTLKDTLPAGITLTGAPTLDGVAMTKATSPVWQANTYYDSGNEVWFFLPAGKTGSNQKIQPQKIVYQTDIATSFTENSIKNNVKFTGGPGEGLHMDKSYTVDIGGGMVTKTGAYHPEDHTIDWTVSLLSSGTGISNAVITDVIPGDQIYIDEEFLSGSSENLTRIYDETSQTLTIGFPNNPSAGGNAQVAKFRTRLTDDKKDLWAVNLSEGVKVENHLTLKANGMSNETYPITGYATVTSTMLAKDKSWHYDPNTKNAYWKVTVNHNKMALTNPVLTDTIEGSWSYLRDCIVSVTQGGKPVSGYQLDHFGKTMVLKLPDTVANDEPYEIIYRSHLDSEAPLIDKNAPFEITNKAVLTANQIPGSVSVTAKQNVGHSVLGKTVDDGRLSSDGVLTWKVDINKDMLTIRAASPDGTVVLSDVLQEGLALDIDSVKLRSLTYDYQNNIWSSQPVDRAQYGVGYDTDSRTFSIDFKKPMINSAYELQFTTDVLKAGSYQNTVSFAGISSGIQVEGKTSIEVSFGDGMASPAFGKKGNLLLKKVDEKGKPLDRAVFSLIRVPTPDAPDPLPRTLTTDDEGEALWELLTPGDYLLTEITAPPGYAKAAPVTVTIKAKETTTVEVKNLPIEGALHVRKTDSNLYPLGGARITLYRMVGQSREEVKQMLTDAAGKAEFTKLPPGSYLAQETDAPEGYHNAQATHSFVVADNGVQSDPVEWRLTNERIRANLQITKQDGTTQTTVEGVTFRLEHKDGTEIAVKTTDKHGVVRFDALPLGEYQYYEISAPKEYVLDPQRYPVVVDDTVHGQTLQKVLINQRKQGTVEIHIVDKNGKAPLAGAIVELLDANQKVVGSATSDANGMVRFENLPVGDYRYRETKAPEGYRIDNTPRDITLSVAPDGTVPTVSGVLEHQKASSGGGGGDSDDSPRPGSSSGSSGVASSSRPAASSAASSAVSGPQASGPVVIRKQLPDPNDSDSPSLVILIDDLGTPIAGYRKDFDPVAGKYVYILDESIPLANLPGNPRTGARDYAEYDVIILPAFEETAPVEPDAGRGILPYLAAGLLAVTALLIPLTLRKKSDH